MNLERDKDGHLTESAIELLESTLSGITDAFGPLMDRVMQKGFIPAFRCCHSGLLLPGDYVKNWGRLYGIGLGPQPVSEVLNTNYDDRLPEITSDIRDIEQIMHPVEVCGSQVDFLLVHPSDEMAKAVMAIDDPKMIARGKIVRAKQLTNPRGKLQFAEMKFKGF